MTFKNGKFYNDSGEVVPLEFGNHEQIGLLKRADDLKEGVWSPFGKVRCLCGTVIDYKESDIGTNIKCPSCDNTFSVREDEEEGFVLIKMK